LQPLLRHDHGRDYRESCRCDEGTTVQIGSRKTTLAILIPVFLGAALPAAAQTLDFPFHWAPCPSHDEGGHPCSPAVRYEVWVKRGSELEELVTSVTDTIYTLGAEPNVVQRIRVCGYDAEGRQSDFSDWSDPIYFEAPRSAGSVPQVGELKGNYPNPFNPMTHIVYGVPSDLPAGATIRLEILDVRGRRVRSLDVDTRPGWHEAAWDGTDERGEPTPTGPYISRYLCGDRVVSRKLTMVK
jgi:hypothetical protein